MHAPADRRGTTDAAISPRDERQAMTIDPDDYDLRELRRIADERRGARRSEDEQPAEESDHDDDRLPSERRRRSRTDRRRSGKRRSDDRSSRDDRANRDDRRQSERISDRAARDRSDERRLNGRTESRRDRDTDRRGARENDTRRRDEERNAGSRDRAGARRRDATQQTDDRDADDERGEVSVRPREDVTPPRRGDSDHAEGHDEVVLADQIARDLGFGVGAQDRSRRGRDPDRRRDDRRRTDSRSRVPAEPEFGADDVGRFQFDTEIRERPRGRAGEALRQNQLEQLLVHETAAAEGLSKPYLGSLPDAYAAERLVFDWLEFLVLKGGFKRTMDALRYYHTVEWLTEDVESELQDYLVGFSGEVTNTTEYDVDDHHLSLVYIARLASMT